MTRISGKYQLLLALAATAIVMGACGSDEETTAGPQGKGGALGDAATDSSLDGAAGGAAGKAGAAGAAGVAGDSGAAGSSEGGAAGAAGGIVDASIDVIPEVSFEYDAPLFDNALSADSACAATTAAAELTPLEAYIMQDRSGSMANYGQADCNVGSSSTWKWCYAINALDGYFQDPGSWNNWVALQYFPITGYSCSTGGACATPAVPRGVLDDAQRTALRNSLNGTVPNGSNTPTEAALRGLASYTANVQPQAQALGHTLIGILITDGIPEGSCNNNASSLKTIVQNHFAATGIRTFVIGMTGADFGTLETIASGGGVAAHPDYCNSGAQCTYYSVGNGNPAVFIEVLKKIQQTAIGCTYKVPVPEAGLIDYTKVKVEYQPGNGDPAQQFDSVPDASQCAAGKWYYDDNNAPTTVTLCPDTCTQVKADNQAKVTLLLGCLGS